MFACTLACAISQQFCLHQGPGSLQETKDGSLDVFLEHLFQSWLQATQLLVRCERADALCRSGNGSAGNSCQRQQMRDGDAPLADLPSPGAFVTRTAMTMWCRFVASVYEQHAYVQPWYSERATARQRRIQTSSVTR